MRPLLALAISIFLLGGVYAYTKFAAGVRAEAVVYQIDFASEEYSVEIRRSFDAVPDPIFGAESLKVKFKGEVVFARTDEIPAGDVIEIRPLEGVEVGKNELYISANRKHADETLGAIQIEIKKDDIPIYETTIISRPGLAEIGDTVVFETRGSTKQDDHEH